MRKELKKRLDQAGVSRIIIERPHKKCRVTIYAARPGVIIGKKGADIDKLRKDLAAMTEGEVSPEHRRSPQARDRRPAGGREHRPAARAPGRLPPRHEALDAVAPCAWAPRACASNVSGRLGGAEIARMEWYHEGRVPRHTLRADIDYGFAEAKTTYGIIGVKAWIFKGEVLEHDPMAQDKRLASEVRPGRRGRRPRRPAAIAPDAARAATAATEANA